MVVVLDRPRHEQAIAEIRACGARVRLISDGDVSGALLAVSDRSPVDLLYGIGGTPEGVISAAAIKCTGGELVGRLWPRDDAERKAALDAGYDLDLQLTTADLVRSDHCFFSATGVTDGDVLQGVRYQGSKRRARRSRSSCGRAPAPCAASTRRTTARSCARSPASATADRRGRRTRVAMRSASRSGSGRSSTDRAGKRRTRDSARSRRASDRRKPCVTMTWMRDWVAR